MIIKKDEIRSLNQGNNNLVKSVTHVYIHVYTHVYYTVLLKRRERERGQVRLNMKCTKDHN